MRRTAGVAVVILLLVGSTVLLQAPASAQEGPIDLLSQYDIRYDGEENSNAGQTVAAGGDVNNDGVPDIIVGAPFFDDGVAKPSAGRVYVIFGDPTPGTVDLASLGNDGFTIDGAETNDSAGRSLARAGDVNNDGYDDILIGAESSNGEMVGYGGSAYVVFGKSTTTPVELSSLGAGGFAINGTAPETVGREVAGVLDVNNDGLDDVAVSAPRAAYNGRSESGSIYVIFGKTTTTAVETATLGAGGFRIDGEAANTSMGGVAGGGDINDDGLADIIAGVPWTGPNNRDGSGSAYVIFGKTTTTAVDLASLGAGGYRIEGASEGDAIGGEISGAGDVDDDGKADILLGAANTDFNSREDSGSVYVVFGKATTTAQDLASLGVGGYHIDFEEPEDAFGGAMDVARAGDVNNDGTPDAIVSRPYENALDRHHAGSVWVVFGKTDDAPIDIADLGDGGFRIDGAGTTDIAGVSVSGLGDLDDDGFDDVLIGSLADINGTNSGAAYVELVADWLPGACANPRSGSDLNDLLVGGEDGDDISGGDGNDELRGEDGEDCLHGEGDSDDLFGGEGIDVVEGGSGGDTIEGADQQDEIFGGSQADTIEGGLQADTIEGEDGEDTLKGQDGGDTLKGGENADTLKGRAGGDELKGGNGGDTLEGGDNADEITGGNGEDDIEAGGGADEIFADDNEVDTIDCGSGSDTVDADNVDILISC